MKKILVICASYRTYSNSEILAASFMEGAKSAGHEVKKFTLRNKLVRPCRACDLCYHNGKPCVIEDDMEELYTEIDWADIVVMASPLYYFGFPAQLKAIIDRLYAFDVQAKLSKNTQSLIDRWRNLGTIFVSGIVASGDIVNHPAMEEAKKLGASLK